MRRLNEGEEDLTSEQELLVRCETLEQEKREWIEGEEERILEMQRQKELMVAALDQVKRKELEEKERQLTDLNKNLVYYENLLRKKTEQLDSLQEEKEHMGSSLYQLATLLTLPEQLPLKPG